MQGNLIAWAVIVLPLVLGGCSKDMIKIQDMPTVEIGGSEMTGIGDGNFRVIVTDIENNFDSEYVSDLHTTLFGTLGRIITESGADRVRIDRGLRDKLKDEFRRIEIEGKSQYTSPKAANLAISGSLDTATVTTSYDAEPMNYDLKDGKFVKGPPQCSYEATVAGSLVFYKINPVEKVDSVTFAGSDTMTQPAGSRSCPPINNVQAKNLFADTLNAAMDAEGARVKSMMASSGAVVLARRDAENNKIYYRTSIKPSKGAVPGVRAEFIEAQDIAGETEEFAIVQGEIVCTTLSRKYSYVEVEAEQPDARIRKGTKVRLVFEDGTALFGDLLRMPELEFIGNSGC